MYIMPSSRDIYLKELMNQLLYQSLSRASFTMYVWPPEDKDQPPFFCCKKVFIPRHHINILKYSVKK